MKTIIYISVRLFLVCTIITGVIYPLSIYLVGQLIFPTQSNGSLITDGEKVIGSSLIGQNFTKDSLFWSRPSACNYDTIPSGASNLSPVSKTLSDRIHQSYYQELPQDLQTASGSGLDPDISIAAAYFQTERIAQQTGLSIKSLKALIDNNADKPFLGIIGPARVNVLKLNIALAKRMS